MTLKEYNECVDLYSDSLFRFILKNIRDKEKAEDIVQDTFEKVWNKISEVPSSNAKSYFFTTAYRTMVDAIRRDKKYEKLNEHYAEMLEDKKRENAELKEILDRALARLPEIQRSVVLLRDYEGYSYKEIGEITQLSEAQVKVYIFRARVALRELIGEPSSVM